MQLRILLLLLAICAMCFANGAIKVEIDLEVMGQLIDLNKVLNFIQIVIATSLLDHSLKN